MTKKVEEGALEHSKRAEEQFKDETTQAGQDKTQESHGDKTPKSENATKGDNAKATHGEEGFIKQGEKATQQSKGDSHSKGDLDAKKNSQTRQGKARQGEKFTQNTTHKSNGTQGKFAKAQNNKHSQHSHNDKSRKIESFKDFEKRFKDEEDFAQLLNEYENKDKNALKIGKIVKITPTDAYIDIGKKREFPLNINELKDENGDLLFKEGDDIKVLISRSNGRLTVSHKKALGKEKIEEFIKNLTPEQQEQSFEVKIISANKGGFVCANKDGVEFFMPRSQYTFKDDIKFVGKSLRVGILRVEPDEPSIVISRRKILDEERKNHKALLDKFLSTNEPIEGTVRTITNYGMFVDIGDGLDGLVHYTELSHKGHINPSSLYKEGDRVLVKVLNYDKDKDHLSLSIKATQPDPWGEITGSLEVGDTIKVLVSNIESYGAFVDVGNDIEGFLHISEITWDKGIKHPKEYISKGDEIDVEVIEINPVEKRLRVSLKNLQLKPFEDFVSKHKVGDTLKGVVTSLTDFGVFVRVGALEGLLHNEDCSWNREEAKNLYKKGDEIEVKLIRIDKERQKLSLSTRELTPSPTALWAKSHRVGEIIKGKVKDIKDFGVFVELEEGIDALIHRDDINIKDIEALKIDDDVEASVVLLDERRNRIRLSVKNLNRIKEREMLNSINANDKKETLGDLIKEKLE